MALALPPKTIEATLVREADRYEMLYDYEQAKNFKSTITREKAKDLLIELSSFKQHQMMLIFSKFRKDIESSAGGEPPE